MGSDEVRAHRHPHTRHGDDRDARRRREARLIWYMDDRKAAALAKTWVLDTETKGTGATMVPLERVLRKPGGDAVPGFAVPELKPPAAQEPRQARAFKLVDVMTRELLGEHLDARAAVSILENVRSIVDVIVYV